MAYLDEYSSKQCSGIIANSGTDAVVGNESEMAITQGPTESVEKGNFQLAQKLSEEKTKLINALSQFPVTALWLLKEYDENCNKTNEDDQKTGSSELAYNLKNIKKYFLSANASFASKEWANGSCCDNKRMLMAALTKHPYSFEDLVKLVDIIAFSYKYRGLCYQPSSSGLKKNAEIIIKRLEGIGRQTKLNASKFFDLIKTYDAASYDEQFLFLTINEMHEFFGKVVFSEHSWLSARQRLASANSRLVLFIANQYRGFFLSFDDIVQEGQVGLIKAVDRFDHRLGFQFSTYAGYWIRQAISRALSRSERIVRIPCGQVANINKVFRAKEELYSRTGAEVSVKELAEYTTFTENEIITMLSISQPTLSLENFDDEEENSFAPIDFLEQQVFSHPFIEIAESELGALIAKALKMLSSREAKIICCHFGIDCDKEMTLQNIGLELNLTRERVRQIQVKALNKLKLDFGQQLMSFL